MPLGQASHFIVFLSNSGFTNGQAWHFLRIGIVEGLVLAAYDADPAVLDGVFGAGCDAGVAVDEEVGRAVGHAVAVEQVGVVVAACARFVGGAGLACWVAR
jgi:hypothetical protein